MQKIGDRFPVRQGDAVRINERYLDLEKYRNRTFYVRATGRIGGKQVVWLRGDKAPISCIAIDGIENCEVEE